MSRLISLSHFNFSLLENCIIFFYVRDQNIDHAVRSVQKIIPLALKNKFGGVKSANCEVKVVLKLPIHERRFGKRIIRMHYF